MRCPSNINDALSVRNYPHQWDDWWTMGRLEVRTRDGQSIRIMFPQAGKNVLCFNLDGVRCRRGGRSGPVVHVADGKQLVGYLPENLALAEVIRLIRQEQTTREKSAALAELFEDLEQSAGKRPPP
jgi:hypothetical protein